MAFTLFALAVFAVGIAAAVAAQREPGTGSHDRQRSAQHSGVKVHVAMRRPREHGPVTAAVTKAAWAFGGGPMLTIERTDIPMRSADLRGPVEWRAGPDDRYRVTSDGSELARQLIEAVLGAFGRLPRAGMVWTSAAGVELLQIAVELEPDDALHDAIAVVGTIAGHGTEVFRQTLEGLEGARVVEPSEGAPMHGYVVTSVGEARLDFALAPHGLTAALRLGAAGDARHASEIDGDGAIVSGETAWLERTTQETRRGIGPAALTLESGRVEAAWRAVPTREQLEGARELLATLSRGVGTAYR